MVSLSFNNLSGANRSIMQGFLAKLDGQRHRFTLHDHAYTGQGILTGTPLVAGASQTGNTIVTDGWTASQTGIVKAGDMISFGDELKMVTADADSDGATPSAATISIVPEIHTSPADNAAITVANPTGVFMLASPVVGWDNRAGVFSNFTIQAIEDILA